MKTTILIVCQTFACMGFGVNIVCMGILYIDGGGEILAKLFELPYPPVIEVVIMTALCFVGTVSLTLGNISSLTAKKRENEEENREITL